jgi:ABC-type branched-subunit amino acid transport system substrate-binding protein
VDIERFRGGAYMSARKVPFRARRTVTAVLALAVLAGALTATGLSAHKAKPAPYTIGWVTGFTGSQATNAAAATQGLQAALAYVNKNNIAGRTIKVYYADDAATPTTSADVCNRLVNQRHVDAIVGFQSTPSTAACETYLTPNNMPYVLAQTSTSGSLCLPNYFSLANVGNQQVNPLMSYLTKKAGTKKVYIVASDFSSGHVGQAAVTAQAQANGATIVGTSYEPLGTSDFTSDISKIAAAQPDTVVDILVGSDETAFYKQFKTDPRSKGIKNASFLMDDGIASAIGGQLLQGTILSTGYFKDNPSKGNQQFIARMQKKYGDKTQISGAAAAAWDGIFMLAHALKTAKSTSGPDVISSLMTAKTSGPRGDLQFKNRHYVSLTTYIVQAQKDGSAKLISKSRRITPIPSNPTC